MKMIHQWYIIFYYDQIKITRSLVLVGGAIIW